jgi:hypothetical protein
VIGIQWHGGIGQKDTQGRTAVKRIVSGLAKRVGGQQHGVLHCVLQPREEVVDHRLGIGAL